MSIRKCKRIITSLLTLLLVVSTVFPEQIAKQIGEKLFVSAAMSVGGSGSITPGSPSCSISGIETTAYRIPPIRVSIYRDKKVALEEENGLDKIYQNMRWGFPYWPYGCIYFMNQDAINKIGNKPLSVAYANTSNGSLTYNSDQNTIDNIVPLGGTTPQNGVYQTDIKAQGIEAYKSDWRSKMTKYAESQGAWSYILANVSGKYYVQDRVQEIFNPYRYDYNNISGLAQYQVDELTIDYLDMLMSLYTVAQGTTKEKWGQVIDDYLEGDNLQESPISICIDSAALMTINYDSYYLLLPTIDYFNYYLGMDPAYQLDGIPWWTSTPEAWWYPGDTYEQLRIAAQRSVDLWPNFSRISDSFNRNNGFSFATTAFATGMLSTSGGTAKWVAAGNAATDYLNMFRLDSPSNPDSLQYGYMLLPAPMAQPQLPIGKLTVEPKDKVIERGELGQPIELMISSGVASSDFGKWENVIKSAKQKGTNFDITIEVIRDSKDVAAPLFIDQLPIKQTLTPDEMLEFVYGGKTITVTDKVERVNTPAGNKVRFDYTINITITNGDRTYTGSGSDYATFKILEPRIGYSSRPEAYSELKNYGENSDMKGNLSEDWEAMAGVPSTEQLYFAAGGSEFIVEVQVERVEDEVAKRTYMSTYSGTECEFKPGDTMAVNQSSFSPSGGGSWIDNHIECNHENGGDWTISASWSGQNPHTQNPQSCSTCGASGYYACTVDKTPFQNALAAANQLKAQLQAENLTHTSASDGKTRTVHWSVSVSYSCDDTSDAKKASGGSGCLHGGCNSTSENHSCKGGDCSPGSPCSKSHAWSISLVATIPPHSICGPCCSHNLPSITDTWAQTFTYDSMKIVDVHVWTIDQAAVNGLENIIKTDVVGAEIVKGRPNIFYNIALKNDEEFTKEDVNHATRTSRAGRVRYSLDPAQHDRVAYNNGVRTNKCDGLAYTHTTNVDGFGGKGHDEAYATGFIYNAFKPGTSTSGARWGAGQSNYPTDTPHFLELNCSPKDTQTVEYNTFLKQRNQMVAPTMITDFLILQTSSGDQAVMYFDKSTPAVTAESQFNRLDVTKEEMWDNNPYSAAKWKEDHINVGGYNGKYKDPDSKFTWSSKGNQPKTVFDPDPAGTIKRPARPNTNLMLYQGELNIVLQDKNKSYVTGDAEVFWKNTLHWVDNSSERYKDVQNPKDTASFETDMGIGTLTGYQFTDADVKLIDTYTLSNGLQPRPRSTSVVNGVAVCDKEAGKGLPAGVFGPHKPFSPGTYIAEVTGTKLPKGEAVLYDNYGATNLSDKVEVLAKTDTKVLYQVNLDVPTSNLEFCWQTTESYTGMTVSSIKVSQVIGSEGADTGYILKAPYSKSHEKINNIVVHDPVSTQDMSVVSLPDSRDQRTGDIMGAANLKDDINNSKGCPRDPALCDFRTINCTYLKDTVLAEYDFKGGATDSGNNPINKVTKNSLLLTNGFNLTSNGLEARGTRLSIPFSELNLQYQSATKLKVEGDITISKGTPGTMIFSFLQYDLYVPSNSEYATLNTGNGWERKSTIPLADGKKHHLEVIFSLNSVDSSRVIIDGKEAYERVNDSKEINSQLVGSSLNIGCWGANNNYPARFNLDNLKVTRLAGTLDHNEDCYKLVMTHPSGLNAHQHNADCLDGTGDKGAQWFIDGLSSGTITDKQAHDILGEAYDPIMQNSFGPIIHTWSNWTPSNMQGFKALNQVNLSTSGGNLIASCTGADPYFEVPVNFDSSGVTKITVVMDNNTSSNSAQMFWSTDRQSGYVQKRSITTTIKPNTTNQTVNFVVRGNSNWVDTIKSLRFDPVNSTGTVTIRQINVYGGGTRVSAGSGNASSAKSWNSPGSYTYSVSPGTYKIETWGAQGGSNGGEDFQNNGAYASTTVELNSNSTLYINVGGKGADATTSIDKKDGRIYAGGYNGGAYGSGSAGSGGGGASDVRLNSNDVPTTGAWNNLIVIAGGGAGSGKTGFQTYGRGETTENTTDNHLNGEAGDTSRHKRKYPNDEGGGGGGYWGGSTSHGDDTRVGYGGTSYVATGTNKTIIAGNATMPSPSSGTQIGQSGNGYVKITGLFSPVTIKHQSGVNGMYAGKVINIDYTGTEKTLTLPIGRYKVELWGAQGGAGKSGVESGGKGGYSVGTLEVSSETTAYIRVGEKGKKAQATSNGTRVGTAYNGGGNAWDTAAGGGGATDLRLGSSAYSNVKIVAGGGGGTYCGSGSTNNSAGGAGGGTVGIGGQDYKSSNRNLLDNGGGAGSATGRHEYAFEPENTNVWGSGGGGGGGYWGGRSGGQYKSGHYGGGGGGSSYIGGVSSASTIAGNATMPSPSGGTEVGHSGNGYARITVEYVKPTGPILSVQDIKKYWHLIPDKLPNGQYNKIWGCDRKYNIHVCDNKCGNVKTLVCSEPHHKGMHYDVSNKTCWEACNNDETHKQYKPTVQTSNGEFTPGNFVNMDYGFTVYFPNQGDFDDGEPHGIGSLTSQRGMGFTDGLDTTKWTREKRIKFEFNVIYKNKLYKANEWITLGDRGKYTGKKGSKYDESKWSNYGTELYDDISEEYYDFYCVLANYEAKSASVKVEVEAVNCPGSNDNTSEVTNKRRGKYASKHGATNTNYVDVVGRIGNLVIEDTGDYRFSNLFKTPKKASDSVHIKLNYNTNNGLSLINKGSIENGKVITSGNGNGAKVSNISVNEGAYRIDILGSELNTGKLVVKALPTGGGVKEDWSGEEFIRQVVTTNNKMSFYLTVPRSTNIDIRWENTTDDSFDVVGLNLEWIGKSADKWVVDGVVQDVDESDQNYYLTWIKDIRGVDISNKTNYLNTYSTLNWMDDKTKQLPLSGEDNTIDILKSEPLLVGYPIYFDISSIGNYWWNNASKVQVVPYYYALDVEKNEILPLDVYFKYDKEYKLINEHGLVTSGDWDSSKIYNYAVKLDWIGEKERRNYTDTEKKHTDFFRDYYAEGQLPSRPVGEQSVGAGATTINPKQLDAPSGSSYVLGNAQIMSATGKARTFIGGETTYGKLMNLGGSNKITTDEDGYKYNPQGRLEDYLWWQSAQRWHLKIALPSSAVFVDHGKEPSKENLEKYVSDKYLILCTADIRVIGDTYVLKYDQKEDNGSINIQRKDGTWSGTIKMPNNIPPVLAVYSTTKTSAYDIDIVSSH